MEFTYLPSRNPYWTKIREDRTIRALTDHDTESVYGRWREYFGFAPEALHVEIGCNGGHFLNAMALQNLQMAFVGIDWKFKQIYFAAQKAHKKGLANVAYLRAHAVRMPFMFGPSEIDHLHVYFPDPWPKRSQSKNRLLTAEWFKAIAPLVRTGGTLIFKTDHADYFRKVYAELLKVGGYWGIVESTDDIHCTHPNPGALDIPEVTLFEKVFIKEKLPISRLIIKRLTART